MYSTRTFDCVYLLVVTLFSIGFNTVEEHWVSALELLVSHTVSYMVNSSETT